MHPLGADRDGRKRLVAEGRDQHLAPEKRDQPGDAQHDERPGQQPVAKALDRFEAFDRAAGLFAVNADAAPDQVEQRQRNQRAAKQIGAIGQQRSFAELQPPHAAILNQTWSRPGRGFGW